MTAQTLTLATDESKGTLRISASGIPNGHVLITRSSTQETPTVIRNGEFDLASGGFVRQDSDPPYNIPLTYRATVTVTSRNIQTNRVLNPKAKTNLNNWATSPGRTLTRETSTALKPPRNATTSIKVSANSAGSSSGTLTDRLLASTVPSDFGSGRWFVSGQVRYDNPDLWLWQDAKDAGTWQAVKDKGTWQQVRSSSSEAAGTAYSTLWVAVLSPTDAVVAAPVQVLGVTSSSGKTWMGFNAWITVPAGAPAGSRLVLLHGSQIREYANLWWVSTVMVTPENEMDDGALPYLDGDVPLPVNPAANLVPGADWQTVSSDSSIVWNGTDNNSVSVFTGPSQITTTAVTTLSTPSRAVSGVKAPLVLSDPVSPQLAAWFELLAIGELSFKERADLYDVLGRGPQIAVSQMRAWASGQLSLMTYTLADISLVERLFASGRILFMRNPDPRYPESNWYLHIGEVTQARVGADYSRPERAWTVPFVRVERPVGLIENAASTTWSAVRTLTWAQVRQQRADWLSVALEPVA